MKHHKIAIIGAGAVGVTTAYALMLRNIGAEIILSDINESRLEGELMDLADALTFSDVAKISAGNIEQCREASIIIITAGVAQKPGETRLELVTRNAQVIQSIMQKLTPIREDAIILIASNPVDVITMLVQQICKLPKTQVIGTGTFLDTQRFRNVLANKLDINPISIHGYILGEHGDSQFPAWSSVQVSTAPLNTLLDLNDDEKEQIALETRSKAYKIIDRKGATYYGIAACISAICENIIYNSRRSVTVSTFVPELNASLSVPVIISEKGIDRHLPLHLAPNEEALLKESAQKVQSVFSTLQLE